MQFLAIYRVRFKPRAEYRGRTLRPSLLQFAGRELIVQTWWMMNDDDRYPGEWALGRPSGHGHRIDVDLFERPWDDVPPGVSWSERADYCAMWIASGDVEVLEQVPDGISDMMARG